MTERIMIRRWVVIGCAVAALAAPVVAQQPPQVDAEDRQLHLQFQRFEAVLQVAVRQGGETFASDVANSIPPGVQLTSEEPQAKGLKQPSGGLMFFVVVPGLRPALSNALIVQTVQSRSRPVAGGRGVGAMGLAPADPMTNTPILAPPSTPPPNPDHVYTVSVCEALINSLLVDSSGLPLKEDEWLTIAAIGGDAPPPGVVNSAYAYTTYLMIKGADLLQFRQGKITKEQARALVQMKQF